MPLFQHKYARAQILKEIQVTVVADMIAELIRFKPKVCISHGNRLEFKGESVSVLKDVLLTFPQICLHDGN